MPDPSHDPDVGFADVVLPGQAIDVSLWDYWTHRDGSVMHYYARGPCPACHAPAQGHIDETPHPIEPLGEEPGPAPAGTPPSEPVEIPVRCTCGHGHGRDNATGCGRRWSILCPRDQP